MNIKEFIDKYVALLGTNRNSLSAQDAQHRSTEFLVACAHLANWKSLLLEEKSPAQSVESAVYSLKNSGSKTVTEGKIRALADTEYQKAREKLEMIDKDIGLIKDYYEIFMNAHIFYRQLSKEDK